MRRKTETKIKGVLQDTQDPRTNCKTYDTGNILNSIIPVLYQSTVTCIHKFRLYHSTTSNAIPKVSTRVRGLIIRSCYETTTYGRRRGGVGACSRRVETTVGATVGGILRGPGVELGEINAYER
jgi:hypothetical protein